MSIPEEVIDQIFEEVKKEINEQKSLTSDKPQTIFFFQKEDKFVILQR